MKVSRNGGLLMDLPRRDGGRYEHVIIGFGERAIGPTHYDNLAPELRRRVDRRLKQLEAERVRDDPELEADFLSEFGTPMGFNPKALEASFGVRDLGCIQYFRRLMERTSGDV